MNLRRLAAVLMCCAVAGCATGLDTKVAATTDTPTTATAAEAKAQRRAEHLRTSGAPLPVRSGLVRGQ